MCDKAICGAEVDQFLTKGAKGRNWGPSGIVPQVDRPTPTARAPNAHP